MPTATMGTADEYLRLTAQPWPTEGYVDPTLREAPNQRSLKAELHLRRLTASHVVDLARDLSGLAEFFDEIAEHWQEERYRRVWGSGETDLRLEAHWARPSGSPEHRGPDYVLLHVTLLDLGAWRSDYWTVTAPLTIQPGEQLLAIARDVRALAGPLD